jgi:hypothetical protein
MTARYNWNLQERVVLRHALTGVGTGASYVVTCDTNANMDNAVDYVQLSDGFRVVQYTWDSSAPSAPAIQWAHGAGTAAQNAATLVTAILAQQPALAAVVVGNTVVVTNLAYGSFTNTTLNAVHQNTPANLAVTQGTTGEDAGGALQAANGAHTTTLWTTAVPKALVIDRVYMVNPTGFAANTSAYWTIAVKNGSTVIASWSTQSTGSGGNGAITAGADTELVLSSTVANLTVGGATAQSISIVATPTGAVGALPPGNLVIEGRYFA